MSSRYTLWEEEECTIAHHGPECEFSKPMRLDELPADLVEEAAKRVLGVVVAEEPTQVEDLARAALSVLLDE